MEVLDEDKARQGLNLMSDEVLYDTDDGIAAGSQAAFVSLYEKGYLVNEGNDFFLNCPKIAGENDLVSLARGIRFHPEYAEDIFVRHIRENTLLPVRITKDTGFAVENPLGGNNIGPLFTLATLWEHKYPGHAVTLATSGSVLAKYAFLRFLTSAAMTGTAGMDELIVWPKVISEGGWDTLDLEKILQEPYQGDMLRVALLSSYSERKQKVILPFYKLHSGRKFVHKAANLRHPLSGQKIPFGRGTSPEPVLLNHLKNLEFARLVSESGSMLAEISSQVNYYKDTGMWNDETRMQLGVRYARIVKAIEPIVPMTARLAMDGVLA